MSSTSEADRIREVYKRRDRVEAQRRYEWHRPEIILQGADYARTVAPLIKLVHASSPTTAAVLDVGCGHGPFLRRLVEWGFDARHLYGAELLADRIEKAKIMSPPGITWHIGDLDSLSRSEFDLVSAHTVFSSILNSEERKDLARKILAKTKAGGWILIFDFRYNNPTNVDVLRVTRRELLAYFAPVAATYRTLHLLPPLARRLAPISPLLCQVLSAVLPVLRSHFVLFMKKA